MHAVALAAEAERGELFGARLHCLLSVRAELARADICLGVNELRQMQGEKQAAYGKQECEMAKAKLAFYIEHGRLPAARVCADRRIYALVFTIKGTNLRYAESASRLSHGTRGAARLF